MPWWLCERNKKPLKQEFETVARIVEPFLQYHSDGLPTPDCLKCVSMVEFAIELSVGVWALK
jgi:hypothetical protein